MGIQLKHIFWRFYLPTPGMEALPPYPQIISFQKSFVHIVEYFAVKLGGGKYICFHTKPLPPPLTSNS